MVQRCNGTTVGLGYLKVLELSMEILLLGQLASVRTFNSQWGEKHGRRNFNDTNPLMSSLLVIFVWGSKAIL
jgi:hypothetical protein